MSNKSVDHRSLFLLGHGGCRDSRGSFAGCLVESYSVVDAPCCSVALREEVD